MCLLVRVGRGWLVVGGECLFKLEFGKRVVRGSLVGRGCEGLGESGLPCVGYGSCLCYWS